MLTSLVSIRKKQSTQPGVRPSVKIHMSTIQKYCLPVAQRYDPTFIYVDPTQSEIKIHLSSVS